MVSSEPRYKLYLKRSVLKDLEAIPKAYRERILDRIKGLAENPRPKGAEKLTAREDFRLRVGPYRILYRVSDRDATVVVFKVAHRKDAYRR